MKIRFVKKAPNQVFSYKGERIQLGDELVVSKSRAEELVSRGFFEKVARTQKTIDEGVE